MNFAGIIQFVLTYVVGIAVKKYPKIQNDYIPAITMIASILLESLKPFMGASSVEAAAPTLLPEVPASILVPAVQNWASVWLFDVLVRKGLFGSILKVKLPF